MYFLTSKIMSNLVILDCAEYCQLKASMHILESVHLTICPLNRLKKLIMIIKRTYGHLVAFFTKW